ncbi:MAG: glycosyltransferase family 2 protein [Candidatus Omnitrophica bacterium]|nr:glycosyltransferase family 2 protein [Candidatus Omnitrophota bacterium]
MKADIAIIIPVFNEVETIREVVLDIIKNYKGVEIIVVNDGSTDGSLDRIKDIDVKVLNSKKNRGYGAALKTGISYTDKELIVTIDADGEHSVKHIERLISEADCCDMVVGARAAESVSTFPLLQKIAKGIVYALFLSILKVKILDVNSGLRLIKKTIIEKYFDLLPDGFSFTSTLTLTMVLEKKKVKYVPVTDFKRRRGSKVHIFSYTMNFIKSYCKVLFYFKLKKGVFSKIA